MGDEQDRARVGGKLLLQPLDGGNIQVVGGLVQQQDIRLADQGLAQGHATAPAAGEGLHLRIAGQLQLTDYRLDPLGQHPAVFRLQLRLGAGQAIHIVFQDTVVVARQQVADIRQPVGNHVVDILLVGVGQGLVQVGDARTRTHPALTALRHHIAVDDLQQGGFARTVAAQQTDAVPRLHGKLHPVQNDLGAVLEAEIVEFQKGHDVAVWIRAAIVRQTPGVLNEIQRKAGPAPGHVIDNWLKTCPVPRIRLSPGLRENAPPRTVKQGWRHR